MFTNRPMEDHESGEFLFIWVVACIFSLFLADWISNLIFRNYHELENRIYSNSEIILIVITTLALDGLLLGAFQWMVLRSWIPHFTKWIGTSTLSWLAGACFFLVAALWIDPFLAGIFFGAVIGLLEWVVLKKYFGSSIWWIVAWSLIGIYAGLATHDGLPFLNGSGMSLLISPVTGLIMIHFLKHPKHTPVEG